MESNHEARYEKINDKKEYQRYSLACMCVNNDLQTHSQKKVRFINNFKYFSRGEKCGKMNHLKDVKNIHFALQYCQKNV